MTLETQKPPPNDKFGNQTPVPEEGNPGTFEKRKKKSFQRQVPSTKRDPFIIRTVGYSEAVSTS
jgi:hypothetical protein